MGRTKVDVPYCMQRICVHCLYLEHVMHEVLAVKVDGAAPVGVVLAERALRVQASQGPERRERGERRGR